jgi:hypothetical protein
LPRRLILRTSALRSSPKFRDHSEFIAIYYSAAMTLRTLTLLAATAMMAVLLLAGCDVFTRYVQHEVQDKVQDQISRVSEDAIVVQPTAILPPEDSWAPCGVDPIPDSYIYVIDWDDTNEARSIRAAENEAEAVLSPDGRKMAFFCPAPPGSKGSGLCMINADGTEWKRLALDVD